MVIGITSALMAISVPAFNLARSKVIELKGMANLRATGAQVNAFANDHDDRYPPSVATIGYEPYWTWYDPRRLAGVNERTPGVLHRSMSAYLRDYIEDAGVLSCPSVPFECKYMQQMWVAGDDWDNPATPASTKDPMTGSLCFYWNYEGLLDPATKSVFRGPWGPGAGRGYSQLLACDHFGYGSGLDIPPTYAYASCEPFGGTSIGDKSDVPRWVSKGPGSGKVPPDAGDLPKISLKALYTDAHAEKYSSSAVVPMWVIVDRADLTAYKIDGTQATPGLFFLPQQAMPQH